MLKEFSQLIASDIQEMSEIWKNEKDRIFEIGENILRINFVAYLEREQISFYPDEEPSFRESHVFSIHSVELNEKDLNAKELCELENDVNYILN